MPEITIYFPLDDNLNSLLDNSSLLDNQDIFTHVVRQIFDDYTDSQCVSIEEFNNLEIYNNKFECSICFENKHTGIKLNCKHVFCKKCIEKWVINETNKTCPMCRKNIKK
jgi:hypothetical protein